MQCEAPKVREFESGADVIAAARALKDKFRRLPPLPEPSIVSPAIAAPAIAPPAKLPPLEPLAGSAFDILDMVASAMHVSPEAARIDIKSEPAIEARKIAAAIAVRHLQLTITDASNYLGLHPETIRAGLALVDPVLIAKAVPQAADLPTVVEAVISGVAACREIPQADIITIQRAVCLVWDVRLKDLVSSCRLAGTVKPRQIAMGIAKHLTLRSYPEIGRRFGGRDHTTVLHAVRKTRPLIEAVAAELPADADPVAWAKACKAHLTKH